MTPAAIVPIRATVEEARAIVSGLAAELPASSEDLEPLLERFLMSILPLAGAQAGAVRVLSDDGQTMRLVAQCGRASSVGRGRR